jgi:hypothetical protein
MSNKKILVFTGIANAIAFWFLFSQRHRIANLHEWVSIIILLETFISVLWYTIETRNINANMINQINHLLKDQQVNAYDAIYAEQQEITRFIASAHPEVRPYFYDGEEVKNGDKNYEIACFIAEMYADFLEHLHLDISLGAIPDEAREGWLHYLSFRCSKSPLLKKYFEDHYSLYSPSMLSQMGIEKPTQRTGSTI